MLVWLVDDDAVLLDTSARMIRERREVDALNVTLKTIRSFRDFEEALAELEAGDAPYPSLVFLDLKLKSVDKGYQALDRIKHHERMSIRSIPTIMFSSTSDSDAVKKTYRKSANAYLEKGAVPSDTFRDALDSWRRQVSLPRPELAEGAGA